MYVLPGRFILVESVFTIQGKHNFFYIAVIGSCWYTMSDWWRWIDKTMLSLTMNFSSWSVFLANDSVEKPLETIRIRSVNLGQRLRHLWYGRLNGIWMRNIALCTNFSCSLCPASFKCKVRPESYRNNAKLISNVGQCYNRES